VARGEVGRVTVPGVDINRPVYLCLREDDQNYRPVVARFLEMILGETCKKAHSNIGRAHNNSIY
ncbi:hypothetical protein ACWGPW_30075, partial [Paenibacillus chitinolyticus]